MKVGYWTLDAGRRGFLRRKEKTLRLEISWTVDSLWKKGIVVHSISPARDGPRAGNPSGVYHVFSSHAFGENESPALCRRSLLDFRVAEPVLEVRRSNMRVAFRNEGLLF